MISLSNSLEVSSVDLGVETPDPAADDSPDELPWRWWRELAQQPMM
jgi:hypothetical protein